MYLAAVVAVVVATFLCHLCVCVCDLCCLVSCVVSRKHVGTLSWLIRRLARVRYRVLKKYPRMHCDERLGCRPACAWGHFRASVAHCQTAKGAIETRSDPRNISFILLVHRKPRYAETDHYRGREIYQRIMLCLFV